MLSDLEPRSSFLYFSVKFATAKTFAALEQGAAFTVEIGALTIELLLAIIQFSQ